MLIINDVRERVKVFTVWINQSGDADHDGYYGELQRDYGNGVTCFVQGTDC